MIDLADDSPAASRLTLGGIPVGELESVIVDKISSTMTLTWGCLGTVLVVF